MTASNVSAQNWVTACVTVGIDGSEIMNDYQILQSNYQHHQWEPKILALWETLMYGVLLLLLIPPFWK